MANIECIEMVLKLASSHKIGRINFETGNTKKNDKELKKNRRFLHERERAKSMIPTIQSKNRRDTS